MADLFSIAAGVLGVLGTITKLYYDISQFVSSAQHAKGDRVAVQCELEALSIPLNQLRESSRPIKGTRVVSVSQFSVED
jgi:hypothetical protein